MSHEEHRHACAKVRGARIHLKYICEKTLQKCKHILDFQREQMENENLISVITSRNQQPLDSFLLAFVNRTVDPSLVQTMAKLLLLLIGDAAMSSVLPFAYCKHILETCSAVRNNVNFHSKLQEMKEYGVELSETLHASTLYNFSKECVQFVEYLVDEVVNVHSNDRETDPVSIIEQSYNPENGYMLLFHTPWQPNKKTT